MPIDQKPQDVASQAAGSDTSGDQPNVSPEEQAMYDATVTAAMKMMFDQKRLQVVVQKLQAGKDNISQAVGHTAAMIMMSIRANLQQQGKQLPDDIAYAAGQEVVGDLCDIAIGAKIMDASKKEEVANAALFEAVRAWGQIMQKNGDITPEVSGQAKQDLADHGVQQTAPQGQAPAAQAAPPAGGAGPQPGIVNAAQGAQ